MSYTGEYAGDFEGYYLGQPGLYAITQVRLSHREGASSGATGSVSHRELEGSATSGSVSHREGASTASTGSVSHREHE
jgi:hypothetical protein